MTATVEADCPVCTSSEDAKTELARATVAEHLTERARRDEAHRAWIDEHTSNGGLAEIREALAEHGRPRQYR